MQARTGDRDIAERCAEPDDRLALAAERCTAFLAIMMFSGEGICLGCNNPLLQTSEQILCLINGKADLLELVVGLVENQNLVVMRCAVTSIDPQPDLDLHEVPSIQFSRIGREENP